ncbi:MAG: hypothetical protein AB9900_10955 [Humidesulfovibrio sp.]
MSNSTSFVLSEEAVQQLRTQLWDAQSMLRLMVDHAEMLINSPGELHSLDGFPAVLQAAADKVEQAGSSLESMHLPRLQGGVVLPARSAEVTPLRREVAHA